MIIYDCPPECPAPTVDYRNFDIKKVQADEDAHKAALKAHLISLGYNKPLTGEIISEQVADGYAQYMVMDAGRQWGLVHLPYGDAYHCRNIEFLPKSEVKRRIQADKELKAYFAQKRKERETA